MNEKKDPMSKLKDPGEKLISALPKESLEVLVERGVLVPFTDVHGPIKYRILSGFNRLFTADYRRRD
jgi:hypothetical protein